MGDPRVKSGRRGSPPLALRSVMTPFSAQERVELIMHLMTQFPWEIKRNAYLMRNELWHGQHWKSKRDSLYYEERGWRLARALPAKEDRNEGWGRERNIPVATRTLVGQGGGGVGGREMDSVQREEENL